MRTGIDRPIEEMRQLFIDNLWANIGASKKEFNHRVERIDVKGLLTPQVLIDGTNDYKRVSFNDRLSVLSWFDVALSTNSADGEQYNQDVGIFFAVNLKDLYPSITYRAQEEAHLDVRNVIKLRPMSFGIDGISIREEAYGDFSTEGLKGYNTHPWHVFRFNCNVSYTLNCK